MRKSLRGFSLLEILIAMVIVTILLVGSLRIVDSYLAQASWGRLFTQLERSFLDANVYALAGFSAGYADSGDSADIPEIYHLYLETGDHGQSLWYLESHRENLEDEPEEQQISFQRYIELPVKRIELDRIQLNSDRVGGSQRTTQQILISWENPFAQLSFYEIANPLTKTANPEELETSLTLPDEPYDGCDTNPRECHVELVYQHPGTGVEKQLMIDLQKALTVESLLNP